MFKEISQEQLARLREKFQPGMKVELIRINDPYRELSAGSQGTVICVDDLGTIHVSWDCGSNLGVVYGEDLCKPLEQKDEDIINKANFVRKAISFEDLCTTVNNNSQTSYTIEAVIELGHSEYEKFCSRLYDDYDFIAQHKALMWVDAGDIWHCILVREKGAKTGILIQSDGYDYARYAAYFDSKE